MVCKAIRKHHLGRYKYEIFASKPNLELLIFSDSVKNCHNNMTMGKFKYIEENVIMVKSRLKWLFICALF